MDHQTAQSCLDDRAAAMTQQSLDETPSLPKLYPKAILGSLPLVGGGGGDDLPDMELSLPDVTIDRGHLASYNRVCGFRLSDELPPTYLHVFAFPVAMRLMTDRSFPLPLLGLVHVRNRIVQRRPVRASESVTILVRAQDLRRTERGTQVDLVAEAEADGERVWSSTSTYLRRGSEPSSSSSGSSNGKEGSAPEGPEPGRAGATWPLAGDVGRRYARVSGDINPIHLHPVTAKLFGFPRAIAHGMWTKARCLAALEGLLPEPLQVDVEFRKPVLLPSKVSFASAATRDGARAIALRDARSGAPHLTGSVRGR
jgi:acyl dehydratase